MAGAGGSILYSNQSTISQQSPSERFRRNMGKKTQELQNGYQFDFTEKGQLQERLLTQTSSDINTNNVSPLKIRNGSLSPTRKLF